MKKWPRLSLSIILFFSVLLFQRIPVYALGEPIWEKVYITDAFGDQTDEYCLMNRKHFDGSYNSASVNEGKLNADIVIQHNDGIIDAYIILYVDETEQLKNENDSDVYYNITIKKADGEKFDTYGILESNSDRIQIDASIDLAEALGAKEGKVGIYLEEDERKLNNYLFNASCDNFEQLYEQEIFTPCMEYRYQQAESFLQEKEYDKAASTFESLMGYKDSASRVEDVYEAKMADAYSNAEKLLDSGQYDEAKEAFLELEGYGDSEERIVEIEMIQKYDAADRLFKNKEFEAARKAFEELGDYRDSAERVEQCTYSIEDVISAIVDKKNIEEVENHLRTNMNTWKRLSDAELQQLFPLTQWEMYEVSETNVGVETASFFEDAFIGTFCHDTYTSIPLSIGWDENTMNIGVFNDDDNIKTSGELISWKTENGLLDFDENAEEFAVYHISDNYYLYDGSSKLVVGVQTGSVDEVTLEKKKKIDAYRECIQLINEAGSSRNDELFSGEVSKVEWDEGGFICSIGTLEQSDNIFIIRENQTIPDFKMLVELNGDSGHYVIHVSGDDQGVVEGWFDLTTYNLDAEITADGVYGIAKVNEGDDWKHNYYVSYPSTHIRHCIEALEKWLHDNSLGITLEQLGFTTI